MINYGVIKISRSHVSVRICVLPFIYNINASKMDINNRLTSLPC